jgi:hypothetical protein
MLVGSEIRVQKKLKARKKEQNFFWENFYHKKHLQTQTHVDQGELNFVWNCLKNTVC